MMDTVLRLESEKESKQGARGGGHGLGRALRPHVCRACRVEGGRGLGQTVRPHVSGACVNIGLFPAS
jgi:hypothetical protein